MSNIVERYERGETLAEIAASLGIAPQTVGKRLRRMGCVQRRYGKSAKSITPEQVIEAKIAYENGEGMLHLAQRFGVAWGTMKVYLETTGTHIRGRKNPALRKGGRTIKNGYILILVYQGDEMASMRDAAGYVAEHRLVVARFLGRPLLPAPFETVHHKNGDKTDNRLDNLQLRYGHHGQGQIARCQSCGSWDIEFLELSDGC